MNQIEKALSDYLGEMCGMRLKPHALTGLAKAAIAAMQPAPQWQRIESAPPPPNTRVLLAWRDWRDGKWLIEAAPYETGERVGPYSNVSRHGSATHWMPLPTPPAGGSDEVH